MFEPKELALPDESWYPLSALWLFDRHNRHTYYEATHQQAPPWDRSKQIKRWAMELPEDLDEAKVLTFTVWDYRTGTFRPYALSVNDARQINLPGKYLYPKYAVRPTPAVMVGAGTENPIRPGTLSTSDDAQFMLEEINSGGNARQQTEFSEGPFTVDWRGEERRIWLLDFVGHSHPYNVGLLLKSRHNQGLWAPGKWTLLDEQGGGPHWMSYCQDYGPQDPRPEIPMPCRQLFRVERIFRNPFKTVVFREDKDSTFNRVSPSRGFQ
jgi:hypothetical protein